MTPAHENDRAVLVELAERAILERGLRAEFSAEVLAELAGIKKVAAKGEDALRDLRDLPWCSIDNDDSRDLDQLTVAETLPRDRVKIYVAIADVDALVEGGLAIDGHAGHNTTTIYTAAKIFPMLPEKLSTDLTSLNPHEERLAVVVEMVVGPEGSLEESDVYRAHVVNHAQLAYGDVAAWLAGREAMPEAVLGSAGLAEKDDFDVFRQQGADGRGGQADIAEQYDLGNVGQGNRLEFFFLIFDPQPAVFDAQFSPLPRDINGWHIPPF